jgi:hypothetical protein
MEAEERLQSPVDTPVIFCYEAGRDGFFPCRRLEGMGFQRFGDHRQAGFPADGGKNRDIPSGAG